MASAYSCAAESLSTFTELLQSLHSQDDVLASQHQQQQRRSQLLQQQLNGLHAHFSDVAQRNDSLTADWHALAAVHQTLQAEYRQIRSVRDHVQDELDQLKRDADDERRRAAERCKQQSDRVDAMGADLARRVAANREKEEEVEALQHERASFVHQLNAVTAQLTEEQHARQSLLSTLADLERRYELSLHEAAQLRTQLRAAEADVQAMRSAQSQAEVELQQHKEIADMIQTLSKKALTVNTKAFSPDRPQQLGMATATVGSRRRERRALAPLDPNAS